MSLCHGFGTYAEETANVLSRGCEPLTPEDIAEVIVFAAGRRENVVVADTLIFPNHQVSCFVLAWHNQVDICTGRSNSDAPKGLITHSHFAQSMILNTSIFLVYGKEIRGTSTSFPSASARRPPPP